MVASMTLRLAVVYFQTCPLQHLKSCDLTVKQPMRDTGHLHVSGARHEYAAGQQNCLLVVKFLGYGAPSKRLLCL